MNLENLEIKKNRKKKVSNPVTSFQMEEQDQHIKLMAPFNDRAWSLYDKIYMTCCCIAWWFLTICQTDVPVSSYVMKQKYFPLLQKRITVLHIRRHTNYNVQKIFLVILKRAAGIHPGSAGQGHCEGQRRDCRDGSVGGHWLKWCLPLLSSLLMSP